MIASPCRRCLEHPSLHGQRWCRKCFAAYRRQDRARKREQEVATGDHASETVQSASNGQEETVAKIPSLRVKIHPYNFLLRFPGGRINPEDVATLKKLRPMAVYEGYAWVEREGR